MTVTKEQVLKALRRVKGPDLDDNIIDLGLVSEVLLKDDRAYFSITVPQERAEELEPLRQAAAKVVGDIDGIAGVTAVLTADSTGQDNGLANSRGRADSPRVAEARQQTNTPPPSQAAPPTSQSKPQAAGLPGVGHLIAVASGKGGVGKSTTTVNVALGLKALGLKVGILDADIFGPSQPKLLGITGRPSPAGDGSNTLNPLEAYGIKCMSMGFMVDEATPVVWRGPMVVSALNQMLREVAWGELDALLIDMPPGTGDVQLTMAQQAPLSGAIIVSTPQDLALIDARKGLNMFRKVDVPVLGIIENMSYFICPSCGDRSEIFGHGGAEHEAQKLGVPFLGGVPLHMDIREKSDAGQPVTASDPDGPHAQIYCDIAAKTWEGIKTNSDVARQAPKIVFE
ncbi:MAG: P-loop NTPase [Hyphomicrobiaceae bacterium]